MKTVHQMVTVRPLAGTGILRPFPSRQLRHADPFVFLDTGAPVQLGKRHIYIGPHPHRGVQPVSLLFRGRIEHRDSLGNAATVRSGGMQWLTAGAGALHEEFLFGDEEGVFHMAQLWVNVPEAHKMDPPHHAAVRAEQVPVLPLGNGELRVYAGELNGCRGPAPTLTPLFIAHAVLPSGRMEIPVPEGWSAAATVVEGEIRDQPPGATFLFEGEGSIALVSRTGGQALIMLGRPIGEPVVMGGGFVTTSEASLERAVADAAAGRLGDLLPSG